MLFLGALVISVTRAAWCTMTLKTNVFKWAGHWHEGGSNVFKSFLSTPKCFTRHTAFIWWKKKGLVWSQTSQTRLSPPPDKRCCHGFDRKAFSLFALQRFWSLVWACCSQAHVCCLGYWQPTAACHRADTLVQLQQSLQLSGTPHLCCKRHPQSDTRVYVHVEQIVPPIFWHSRYWTGKMSRISANQSHGKERERVRERNEKSGVPLAFSNTLVSSISLKVRQAEFTPAEIRGFAACACVCGCIYLYLLHLKFHNLHWESTCVFHCVNVCLTVRVMCACKCTGREAGASLNKSTALFWTISFAKKDISSSISGTTCPPSLHCADNSIIHPPTTTTAALPSLVCLPEIPLFLLYPACLHIKSPNGSFSWWLNIYNVNFIYVTLWM